MRRSRKGSSSVSAQVKKNTKKIKALTQEVELKYHDVTVTTSPLNNAVLTTFLSDIDQGLLRTGRVGNKVRIKRIDFNMSVGLHASATNSLLRFMIIRQKNNQIPAGTGILKTLNMYSHYNADLAPIAEILWNKVVTVTSNDPDKYFERKLKKTFTISYNGADGIDLARSNLYLMAISDEPVNAPQLFGHIRLWFTDS